MEKTAVLIPARYDSTRFPGKPLALLDGVPMIRRVVEQCKKTGLPVYVLTDHKRVAEAVIDECVVVIDHTPYQNGTERCASVINKVYFDVYENFINVQGDMPDIDVDIVEVVNEKLSFGYALEYPVVTAYTDLKDNFDDPNTVKAIVCKDELKWCGRGFKYGYHHLGIYGYTRAALKHYPQEQSLLEIKEGLEQLRWLEEGYPIGAVKVQFEGVEINTPDDVKKWHKLWGGTNDNPMLGNMQDI